MASKRWLVAGTTVGVAVLAVLTVFLIAWVGADAALNPDPPRDSPSLDAYPFPVEDVSFPARDGTLLAGWFIAAAPPAGEEPSTTPKSVIVLVHGYGGTRDIMLPQADMLSAAGFDVFIFDLRGAGHSSDAQVTFGAFEPLDVLGAIDYLVTRPDVDRARIGVVGVAMGGSIALMAAAGDPRIRAVVAESPYASLEANLQDALADEVGLPGFILRPLATRIVERRLGARLDDRAPLNAAARLGGRPVLVIDDSGDSSAGTQAIYEALASPKTLWVAHGARRGEGLQEFPSEYVRRVLEFLRGVFERQSPAGTR